MKLATIKNGRPDGQLVVVSTDLKSYVSAGRISTTLQSALDDWDACAPQLAELYVQLNEGGIASQDFDQSLAMAPLPRAFQWIDGAGYLGHLERVRSLKGSVDTQLQSHHPLMYQGASDALSAPTDAIEIPQDNLALDFEAEVAVITGPVPMGASTDTASAAIRLVTICNDVSLRRLVQDDLQNGFGFFHAKPATSFAPVVVTPNELGANWRDNRLHLRVRSIVNDDLVGQPDAGVDMFFDFADIISAATRTRRLGAGTIIGSGTIANTHDQSLPIKRDGIGFACIAEARTVEKIKYDQARTPFLADGDRVRIAALDAQDNAVFGEIDQIVRVTPSQNGGVGLTER